MDELISIIVPVYNAEKTLRRCVRSLVGQTYRNLEIILVNDGSKDGSLDICREFAGEDARIRVIDQPNGGVSSARNAGLDAATGTFVMFCDSDDWTEPDWCEAMRGNYEENDLTICEIDRDDIPLEKAEHPQILETAQRKDFLHRPLLMCALYNKFFARNVIEDNHLRFPEQLSLGEDFAFVLSYVCVIGGNLRYLHRALYHYDTTGEDGLSKKAPSLEQCVCFYQLVTNAMEALGAVDGESVAVRDWFVLTHFDRLLIAVSLRGDCSIAKKLGIAGTIGALDAFRQCKTKVVTWSNPVYCELFHKKHTKLAMIFLIIRNKVKNRRNIQ